MPGQATRCACRGRVAAQKGQAQAHQAVPSRYSGDAAEPLSRTRAGEECSSRRHTGRTCRSGSSCAAEFRNDREACVSSESAAPHRCSSARDAAWLDRPIRRGSISPERAENLSRMGREGAAVARRPCGPCAYARTTPMTTLTAATRAPGSSPPQNPAMDCRSGPPKTQRRSADRR